LELSGRVRERLRVPTFAGLPVPGGNGTVKAVGPTLFVTAIVVLLVAVSTRNDFYGNLVIATLLAAILALGFNMIAGFGGRLAFGNQIFFGVGAYAIAVGSAHRLWSPLEGLGIGIVLSFVVAVGLGFLLARLSGMLFALSTFALALIAMGIFDVTGWLGGDTGLEEPLQVGTSFSNLSFSSTWELALAAGVVVIAATAVTSWLALSGWGAKLRSARDDRIAAETCGVNVRWMQSLIWGVSAGTTAIAGALFIQNTLIVEPSAVFGFNSGIEVIVPAIVGGLGTVVGPVIGSGVIFAGGLLNQLSASGSSSGLSEFFYGAILIVTVRVAPGGIMGLLKSGTDAFRAVVRRADTAGSANTEPSVDTSSAGEPSAEAAAATANGTAQQANMLVREAVPPSVSQPAVEASSVPEPAPVLRISDVAKSFGSVQALAGVSFDLKRRSVLGLIGPNGSGKTTLFNCISGVIKVDRGSIQLGHRELTGLRPYQVARTGIARTYQTVRLFATASVVENVEIPLLWRMTKADARKEAVAALEAVGLSPRAGHMPSMLGLAERRKLELARAIVTGSQVILLDEVMAGLSRDEGELIGQLLTELCTQHGISFVVVEHVMEQLVTICTEVVAMDLGRVLAQGTPNEVLRTPEVLHAYFGVPEGAES
jgi:branched-chain amino acid transport system permease protein